MKKLLIALGILVGLLVITAIVVPLVVDVNKYRPLIEQKANEQLKGKLSVGPIDLSLWGQLKFKIDGLKLEDAKGTTLVQVKDVSVRVPFWSLLVMSPKAKLVLAEPVIHVIKNANGKLNLMSLMKSQGAEAAPVSGADSGAGATQGGTSAQTAAAGGGSTALPGILMRSTFTFMLEHAKVTYKDELTGDHYNVSDLSLHLKDVSPSSTMPFDAEANLDLEVARSMKVKGPLKLNGNVKVTASEGALEKFEGHLVLLLDDLDLQSPGMVSKKRGVPLRLEAQLSGSKTSTNVPSFDLVLADVRLQGHANTQMKEGATIVDVALQSNKMNLEKLGELTPVISQNGIGGNVELSAKVTGPTDHLNITADVKLNGVTYKSPAMQEALTVSGEITVVPDQLKHLNIVAKSSGVDVTLNGTLMNFKHPHFRFNLQSREMDLDRLFKKSAAPQTAEAPTSGSHGGTGPGGATTTASTTDYNIMFKPLRENPILASAVGNLDFSIQTLKSSGAVLKNVKGQVLLNELLMQLKGLSFNVFEGAIRADTSINARNPKPEVGLNADITNIKTESMVESQMSFAKNTMKGTVSSHINLGGAGLNRGDINSTWRGSGTMTIKDAKFSTMDVGKQIKSGLLEKLPDVVRSKVNISDKIGNWKGEYSILEMKFNLAQGTLNLTELTGKAVPNQGLDLKGSGRTSIVNYDIDVNADFIDRYQMLGAQFPKDQRYGTGAVSTHVTGTMFSPHFDWTHTLQQLAKSAMKDQGQQVLKKGLENVKVPDAAKNLLKGLFH